MIAKKDCKVQPTWNDVYKNNNVFDLPWVDADIRPELKKVIDSLPSHKGRALDVGCGLGQVSRYLAKVGFDVTAIDVSEEAIKLSKKLTKEYTINYLVSNSIMFQDKEKYELIIDFLHIHDITKDYIIKYLNNLKTLLKHNAYLIISTFCNDDKHLPLIKSRESFYVDQLVYYYPIEEILKVLGDEYSVVQKPIFFKAGKGNMQFKSYILLLKKTSVCQ